MPLTWSLSPELHRFHQAARTRSGRGPRQPTRARHRGRWRAEWQENSAEQAVNLPVEHCFAIWEDREGIPRWMPWLKSVEVNPRNPKESRWLLSTNQFGRDWSFSWLAENLTPTRNQKIHWRSIPGTTGGSLGGGIEVANRGQIRFYQRAPDACSVKLTISYDVPSVLRPFAAALTPVVEGILAADLRRFASLAERGDI